MKNKLTALWVVFVIFTACKSDKKIDKPSTVEVVGTESTYLAESPRHHEWIDLKRENGTNLKAFVVYPERKDATKAVIVIHENRGLNDWARAFADKLAEKGFLAIAPDLISNTMEGIEKTTDFENSDKAREAIYNLDPEQVTKDLNATYNYVKNDASSNGKISVVGFCWGGSQSFRYATNNPNLEQALVFYGTGPEDTLELQKIQSPVYGFYGGDDNRVNATIPATEEAMKNYGKTYEYEVYQGAGHAFMRRGAEKEADTANKEAHDKAWEKLLSILK